MIAVGWHPIFRASHHQAATDGIRKSPLPERRAHRGADADDCAASASIRASTASRTASSASSTGLRRIRVHQVFRPGLHEFELGCESPRLTCCGHVGSPRWSMSVPLPALGVQKRKTVPCTCVHDTATVTVSETCPSRAGRQMHCRDAGFRLQTETVGEFASSTVSRRSCSASPPNYTDSCRSTALVKTGRVPASLND